MGWKEFALTFLLSCACALAAMLARLGYSLGSDMPPEDPAAFAAWRRRRLWTLIAEFSTLPAFGAAVTAASFYWSLSIPAVVLLSMLSGALGFAFILDGLQRWAAAKINAAGGAGNA